MYKLKKHLKEKRCKYSFSAVLLFSVLSGVAISSLTCAQTRAHASVQHYTQLFSNRTCIKLFRRRCAGSGAPNWVCYQPEVCILSRKNPWRLTQIKWANKPNMFFSKHLFIFFMTRLHQRIYHVNGETKRKVWCWWSATSSWSGDAHSLPCKLG